MTELEQSLAITIPQELIEDFCQRWNIKEFYLFGSVLRDDFNEQSDIDIMVQSLILLLFIAPKDNRIIQRFNFCSRIIKS